jgi:thiol-disulfide isomerase/thioredoxin
MKLINLRLVLLVAFCGVATLSVLWFPAGQDNVLALESESEAAETELGIGSPAPKLDIEHWIQDGNGFFKPVTEFKPGNVYVVEFWATWCPPCVASMPHLAELQNRYRGQNVQIISISDEPLKTVKAFLERKTDGPDGDETTFAEITASYSLTTDPDRSAHEDYMEAAQQQGIPTSFLVGKDGMIEWIGHPMEIDEPLEQVVKGTWNRQEFADLYVAKRAFTELIQKVQQQANRGNLSEAVRLVETELKKKQPKEIEAQLVGIKQQLKMMDGSIDDEVTAYFKKRLDDNQGEPIAIARLGASLYQAAQQQDENAKAQPGLHKLINLTITALQAEVEGASKDIKPLIHDTLARLQQTVGDLDGAIKSQQAAVDSASGPTQERLQRFLDELKEAKDSGGQ